MEFDIKLDYSLEDLDAYWKAFYQKQPGKPGQKRASPRVHRNLGLFFLAIGLLTAVWMSWLMGGLEIILGLMLLYSWYWLSRPPSSSRWAKRVWKKYQASGELYNCCFTEDGVWIHDSKSDHRYDYDALEALWEDGERFYLLRPGNGAFILRKNAFTQGRPEDLPACWTARTGKPVEPVG